MKIKITTKNSNNMITTPKNLAQSFEKLKAIEGAEQRKENVISEFRNEFIRHGFSYWMADKLAKEKYNSIHKLK